MNEATPHVRRDVARNVGRAPAELTRLFLDDPTAFLGADGMVGYIDPIPTEGVDAHDNHDQHDHAATESSGEAEAATSPAALEALEAPPDDVFALHSLPSSTKVIYLDFDGHQMQNEYWNSQFSIGPYTNEPYDIDGDPTSFSDTERDRIIEILQRVADDYAPFDIDVTTEDPGIEGLRRTSQGDTTYGTRMVITSSDWFAAANGGRRIGGIALLNVFTSGTDHASYVFSATSAAATPSRSPMPHRTRPATTSRSTTTAPSTSGYYSGHGDWGPIMGTPYSRLGHPLVDGAVPRRRQHHRGRPRRNRRTRRVPNRRPRRCRPRCRRS